MGKIAFVFAGQGAQFSGMGKELFENFSASRAVFERADAVRPGTSLQCFSGTEDELKQTKNTQPCMFAVELAAAAALENAGVKADMAAGFSLGELAALVYSKAADFETGMRLVMRRGELMQACAEKQATAMAAVLKLKNEDVERVCLGFESVYPVNYNCPGQVAVAGTEGEMPAFLAAVKAAGGRAIPLKVAGGFHSPFMTEASDKFGRALSEAELRRPEIPLYSNCTGEVYTDDIKGLLQRQIASPVLWEKIVRNMTDNGADTFIELGPGRTLCGLISKTDSSVRTFGACSKEDIEKIIAEVK